MFFLKLVFKLVIVYSFLTLFIYYFLSDRLLYPIPKPTYEDSEPIIKLKTSNHQKISAIFFKPPDPKAYTILMSHGNGEDLGLVYPFLKKLNTLGFGTLGYDYQGYGTSEGRASEQNTYTDVQAAYDFLVKQQHIPPEQILLYGRSLGTGPTIELATHEVVGGVILQAPFLSAFRCITQIPLFPVDKYRNLNKIDQITVPTLVIHGHSDGVVPFWQGRYLYRKLKSPKMAYFVPQAGHNDLLQVSGEVFWQTLLKFIKSLDKPVVP